MTCVLYQPLALIMKVLYLQFSLSFSFQLTLEFTAQVSEVALL